MADSDAGGDGDDDHWIYADELLGPHSEEERQRELDDAWHTGVAWATTDNGEEVTLYEEEQDSLTYWITADADTAINLGDAR